MPGECVPLFVCVWRTRKERREEEDKEEERYKLCAAEFVSACAFENAFGCTGVFAGVAARGTVCTTPLQWASRSSERWKEGLGGVVGLCM